MKTKLSIIVLIVGFFATVAIAAEKKTYGNITATRLVSVYDGDTFRVDIDTFPPIIGQNMPIRVYGIDTPEIRGNRTKDLAMQAKNVARLLLENARVIELRNMRRGKYFRIIAEVWLDGISLSQVLIDKGLAKPYFGGKRPQW